MKYDFLIEKLTLSSKRTHKTVTSFPETKWLDSPGNDLKTAKELFTHILVARWTHFQFIKDLNVDREKFGVHIRRLTPKTPSELIAEEQKMSEEMVSYFSGLSELDWESVFLGYGGHSETRLSFLAGIIEHEYHHRAQLLLYIRIFAEIPPNIYAPLN